MALPDGIGVLQDLAERGQALALDRRSSAARTFGRRGGIQTGVKPQPGDDADIAADGGEEFDGGERGVADENDAAAGQPAVDLQGDLACAIHQRLGRARFPGIEALGRGKHGEKGQPHDAAGPRYMDEQLRGQPAQAAGLHKVSLGGADGITVDAAGADLVPPAPLDRVVDANHHGGVRADEAGDQQAQQPACHGAGRPHRPVEHAMVDREVVLLLPPKDAQCRRDGALARRQNGTGHQQQDILPGRAGELLRQAGEPRQHVFRQRGLAGCRDRIGLLHPIRRIDSAESRQAPVVRSGRGVSCAHSRQASATGKLVAMTEADPTLASDRRQVPPTWRWQNPAVDTR